jgi:hypothetical protein
MRAILSVSVAALFVTHIFHFYDKLLSLLLEHAKVAAARNFSSRAHQLIETPLESSRRETRFYVQQRRPSRPL